MADAYKQIELPTGKQELPGWLVGAELRMNKGFVTSPELILHCNKDMGHWDNQVFEYNSTHRCYVSYSGDGRAIVHYHSNTVTQQTRKVFRNGKYETMTLDCTAPAGGYGNRQFLIKMADGTDRLLVGPWHGCPLPDYWCVSFKVGITGKPWEKQTSYFGAEISKELYRSIVAAYLPHMRIVEYTEGFKKGWWELYNPAWEGTKEEYWERLKNKEITDYAKLFS